MSSENDRNRKGTIRKSAVVGPEAASDHSTIQNVFDFIQDYVPQAVSGPKEERKERVLWARFEVGEVNDLSLPHISEVRGTSGHGPLPLLLILGLSNGYSVWTIMPGGDAREVYYCYGEGETARTVRLLKTPEEKEGVAPDAYADKRPIIAVVKKGRHSSTGSTVAYSTLSLLSLRMEEDNGQNVLKKYVFKTRPIMDVQCNRRVVAVVFQKRIVILCAGSLENRFVIKNNYPSVGFPCNPIALGERWLAYSETKLSSKHQSIGGMSHTTTSSMATTMLKNVRKGISALTETISGLTAKAQGTSVEPTDKIQQDTAIAGVVTVIDTDMKCQQQEVKLQDLAREGRQGAVVAHFVAHAEPDVHIAALAFNPSGNLLVSASTEGHSFHVFQLLPHPFLSSETAVHHLYTLYRGATSGVVQDITFSSDSRWVAVSTLNGTTHVFPISPYGGEPSVRTHTSSRVVNKMSRFHTSAGMDFITKQYHHSHNSVPNSKNSVPRSSQSHAQLSQSPPTQSNYREVPSSPTFVNGYNSWSNPRSLPLPTPVSVTALQQVKQPYQSSSVVGGVGNNRVEGVSVSVSGTRMEVVHGAEPSVTLAGPDAVCVRAVFGEPSDVSGQGAGLGSTEDGASYSLYVLGGNGVLVEHHLTPQKLSTAPEGEDAPVELLHYSKLCWKLMGNPVCALGSMPAGSVPLPLKEDNPLVTANELHRRSSLRNEHQSVAASPHEFTPSSSAISTSLSSDTLTTTTTTTTTSSTASAPSDDKWLSQVEIVTHAPPSRRLWMGPQFTFKPHQSMSNSSPGVSNSVSGADLIKTPSPPNTIIYSGSLNSSVSSNIIAQQVMAAGSRLGGGERMGREEQSAVLFPCAESPLLDILSETAEVQGFGANSSPLAVPRGGGGGGKMMEPGQKVIDSGMEVFGSWNKVTPHYEGGPFEGELERQLQDAMGEQEASSSITIVTRDNSIKTGFSPPGP